MFQKFRNAVLNYWNSELRPRLARRWELVLAIGILLGVFFLGARLTGLSWPWSIRRPLASPQFPLTIGYEEVGERAPKPSYSDPKLGPLTGCSVKAVAGVLLSLSSCKENKGTTLVALVPLVAPPGYSDTAKKTIQEETEDAKLYCTTTKDGYGCHIGAPDGIDLREVLLEAGVVAAVPEPVGGPLHTAQERAKASRAGIWWDWDDPRRPEDADPLRWRTDRDAMLSNADNTRAQRISAFGVFVGGAFASFSVLLGFYLSKERREFSASLHETG